MSRWDRTMITLAHWGRTLLVAVGVVVVAGYALPLPAGRAVVASGTALLLVHVVAVVSRARMLCPRCAEDVPLDPDRAVKRHDRSLRIFHRAHLTAVVLTLSLSALFIPGECRRVIAVAMAAVYSVLVLANVVSWRHARLYPWCPHCRRWDDGGRREPSPDPDPTASPERVR